MGTKSIVCIGDVSVDNFYEITPSSNGLKSNLNGSICFKHGDKINVDKIYRFYGGSALNCAIGFSKIGLDTKIASVLGDDHEGFEIIKYLNSHKVNTYSTRRAGNTNQATILIVDGERTILSYHEERNYNILKPSKTDWIYLASAGKDSDDLLVYVRKKLEEGTRLAFNPGSWEILNFDKFVPILKFCDILIVNKTEAGMLFGNNSIVEMLKKSEEKGARISIITDGKNGTYIRTQNQSFHVSIYPSKSIDPTGAGDAFSSAMVGSYLLGNSLETSLKWGMINAAHIVEQIGANKGLLSKKELEELTKEVKSIKISKV